MSSLRRNSKCKGGFVLGDDLDKVFSMAKEIHTILSGIVSSIEPEDNSGNLTSEYLGLTTALLGCKTVITQMEKMDANRQ
jgi:hypothetical protein